VHPEALRTLYDLFFLLSQGCGGQRLAGAQAGGAPILAEPVESSVEEEAKRSQFLEDLLTSAVYLFAGALLHDFLDFR
jgi:hypothetical protein